MVNDTVRVVSFDIGSKNLAFYTEDVKVSDYIMLCTKIKEIKNKDLISRRNGDGKLKNCIDNYLNIIYEKNYRVDDGYGVFDISDGSGMWNNECKINLINLLKKYSWLWNTIDILIIEQQYINLKTKKSKQEGTANIKAIKIAECIYMWFLIHHQNIEVEYFCSKYKTQLLGAPFLIEKKVKGKIEQVKMTKYDRKKWSIQKTLDIFTYRQDNNFIEDLIKTKKNKQKLDDVCDCFTQLQAWKFKQLMEIKSILKHTHIKREFKF